MAIQTYTKQFDSIGTFYKYLCDTPFNEAFRWTPHKSVTNDYRFTQTHDFNEAVRLLKQGWPEGATKLNTRLQANLKSEVVRQTIQKLDVAGFQPVVPLYLAGVPTNMVSKQFRAVPKKVLDIVKPFNYSAGVSTDQIVEQSALTLAIVRQLESRGYRVNLWIALGSEAGSRRLLCSVKVKSANERLQVSKLAFPMVHPSMLRRLLFRYIEVCPDATASYVGSYGRPTKLEEMRAAFPGKYVMPAILDSSIDISKIHNLEDLYGVV